MQGWFSIVTTPPQRLLPIQCFPHVDGTNPRQIGMMLYLNGTPDHGGTAFYRHRSTGLEALTDTDWPGYRAALEGEIARTGLPRPAYPSDGAPFLSVPMQPQALSIRQCFIAATFCIPVLSTITPPCPMIREWAA